MDPFQREVIERLARVETKLDAVGGHDARIRTLETNRSGLTALVAGGSAVLGAVVAALPAFLKAS